MDLLHSCGDEEFFRNGLLEVLTAGPKDHPENFDLGQTISVARSFAKRGDGEMKKAMYRAVADAGFEYAGHCYGDLIKLDGLSALLVAAERFPTAISGSEDWLWQVGHLIYALQDRDGEEVAHDELRRAEMESAKLAQMLAVNRAFGRRIHSQDKTSGWPDYVALKRMMAESPGVVRNMRYAGWGEERERGRPSGGSCRSAHRKRRAYIVGLPNLRINRGRSYQSKVQFASYYASHQFHREELAGCLNTEFGE